MVEDARRITSACDLPLLVDVDTGFGSLNSIQKTVKMMEKENVAAIHIEDQVISRDVDTDQTKISFNHRDARQD